MNPPTEQARCGHRRFDGDLCRTPVARDGLPCARHAAAAVACPACGAPANAPCSRPHRDRVTAGMKVAVAELDAQHHRSVDAQKALAAAGGGFCDCLVSAALACTCRRCPSVRQLTVELVKAVR